MSKVTASTQLTITLGGFTAISFLVLSSFASNEENDNLINDSLLNPGHVAWLTTSAALVLLMTPGLAFFYGGMVHNKNTLSTMMQSFISIASVSILWIFFLFSLCFGDSLGGVIGNPNTYAFMRDVSGIPNDSFAPGIPFLLYAFFQLKFALITPALITGSFSERVYFSSWGWVIMIWTALVYAPVAHWVWHPAGFLRVWGAIDFAGGTVVHLTAGVGGMAGAIYLGKGEGSYNPSNGNIGYILLGTGLLWFGWFGFNAGSALTAGSLAVLAAFNTHLAASSAMITWVWLDYVLAKKPSASGACIASVIGLVGVTPAAGFVNLGAAMLIGSLTVMVCRLAMHLLHGKFDDRLEVFCCHGVGGATGQILTGLFATTRVNSAGFDGAFYGNPQLLGKHIAAVLLVGVYTYVVTTIVFWVVDKSWGMTVPLDQQKVGLDSFLHGESHSLVNLERVDPNFQAALEMSSVSSPKASG